jgi:LCP family protein required for cell wall assembly
MNKTQQSRPTNTRANARAKAIARKKKRQRQIILLVVEILILLILALALFVALKLSRIEKDTSFSASDVVVNEDIAEESIEIMSSYTTIALFGLDNRSNGKLSSGRSDVIIIACINNDTHDVKLVSVYRDTYLDTGDSKYRKCNAAYSSGGPEQAINMLNKNLDLNITDYVTVDFNAVVECVDLLGGVVIPEVSDEEAVLMYGYMDEINKLTKNNSQYLSSGGTNVLMDGVQACAYARIRQTSGDDYKRTERQRTVIAGMVEKAKKSDLKTISSLIDTAFGDILTSYSNTDLIALATQIFNYNLGETTGFPFQKNSIKLGSKGDVVVPCDLESNVIELHEFLYEDENYTPSETVKSNSAKIINDTGYHEGDGY